MRYVMTLFLLFTIPYGALSQKVFLPGYIITVKGDTLRGKVCDRSEAPFASLFTKIRFIGENGKRKKFKPEQVSGYRRGDYSFESVWTQRQPTGLNIFNETYLIRSGVGEKVFLKVLEKGPVIHYQDEFVDEDSDFMHEVDYFRKSEQDYMVRATQGIFGLKKRVLEAFFKDCPSLTGKIRNNDITRASEVVHFYNMNCPVSN